MSEDVQDAVGYALDLAQHGRKAPYAKPMHGADLRNVMEIVAGDDHNREVRGTYTVKFGDVVYVLDVFVKKSKSGIETPKRDEDRIRQRYKQAKEHYEENNRYKRHAR
ncbi:MAG TPA: type II toxin-antitoxin system RelE/ParE family toxin [Candidatus Elarobacter sp.]|jgi:phage-related protein|nr:type II toxin-antitoxin system RelE/ParE family toxin [Candidatus Elarobacter sp.]